LFTAVLARQAAAAVGVRNCCYVAGCSVAEGASAPTGGEGGIPWWPHAYSLLHMFFYRYWAM